VPAEGSRQPGCGRPAASGPAGRLRGRSAPSRRQPHWHRDADRRYSTG